MTLQSLAKAQKYKAEKVVVICKSAGKDCFSFSKKFDIEFVILDQYETYSKLYMPYNFMPEVKTKYKKEKALAFKDLAMYSLNRSRERLFFLRFNTCVFFAFRPSDNILLHCCKPACHPCPYFTLQPFCKKQKGGVAALRKFNVFETFFG